MAKTWDKAYKIWIRAAAESMVAWLAGQQAIFVEVLSTELRDIDLDVDGLIKVRINGQEVLLHIECQTYRDEKMPLRLLRYNVEAQWEHKKPVYSFVLHLLGDGEIDEPPLHLALPDGRRILDFDYTRIELNKMPAEAVRTAGIPELLPCLPLTKGGAQKEAIEYMAHELERTGNTELEVVGFTFASLAFRKQPEMQQWLLRRFKRMGDLLNDTPLMQEILSWGREEGVEIGREAGIKIGKLEVSQKFLIFYVEAHFPDLKALAEQWIASLQQSELLESLVIKVAQARTEDEVCRLLSPSPPTEQ